MDVITDYKNLMKLMTIENAILKTE